VDDGLSRAIAAFDGADFAALEAALLAAVPTAEQLAGLVVLLEVGDARARLAAAWSLATAVAAGAPLLPAERRRVLAQLERAEPPARAQLCRAVRALRVPPDVAEVTCATLERLAADDERAVRRWAIDGLDGLAVRFPALRSRADAVLDRAAAEDPAPSVRAHARRLTRPAR
jgi:hypothetical protein